MKNLIKRLYRNLPGVRELRLVCEALDRLEVFTRLQVVQSQSDAQQSAALQASQFEIQSLLSQPRYSDPKKLNRFEFQVFSQNGEDGIIAEIFRRIGTTSRKFVEIGVGDGLENNTTFLLTQGWSGAWIEGNPESVGKIQQQFCEPLRENLLRLQQAFVTAENIASLLEGLGVETEFDLLSLDIDRNTYFVWEALTAYKPRVVAIEYNAAFPPDVFWTVKYDAERVWNETMYQGASLKAMEQLGEKLGYRLVGCDLHGINAFFVRADLCGEQFAEPLTAENHFEPLRHWLIRRPGHTPCFDDRYAPPASEKG